jgi:hypothetical protein
MLFVSRVGLVEVFRLQHHNHGLQTISITVIFFLRTRTLVRLRVMNQYTIAPARMELASAFQLLQFILNHT